MCNNICKCVLISTVSLVILFFVGIFLFVGLGDETYLAQHAFLVAGSKGYENYRHQADVLNVYRALRNGGFPDENIVLMMYDDIVQHPKNPTPGVITNYPGGPNLYENVTVDYSGKDVSPLNFLNVLLGDAKAMRGVGSGRVMKSGMFENTFVYFAGYGGPGMIYFPSGALPGDIFLKRINKRNALGKITMFIDASYSGSFLEGLVSEKHEFIGVTSTGKHGQPLAGFYDKKTFLTDVFSLNFVEEAVTASSQGLSLDEVVNTLAHKTPVNSVHKYGKLKWGFRKFSELINFGNITQPSIDSPSDKDTVEGFDVEVRVLERLMEEAQSTEEREHLETQKETLVMQRLETQRIMEAIIKTITDDDTYRTKEILNEDYTLNKRNLGCFKELFTIFTGNCFSVFKRPYVATHLYKIVNMCSVIESGSWLNKLNVVAAMSRTCTDNDAADPDAQIAENMLYSFGLSGRSILGRMGSQL